MNEYVGTHQLLRRASVNYLAGYSASSSGDAQYFCESKYYSGLMSHMVVLEG